MAPEQLNSQTVSAELEKTTVLVVGGAGYVGSATCHCLKNSGFTPVVLDDLSKGHAEFLPGIELEVADFTDPKVLEEVFKKYEFDAVLHFAALSEVAASTQQQEEYFRVNVEGTEGLLEAMSDANVRKLVFSSSAAVYGNPSKIPIPEDHPLAPVNPYGETKLRAEQAIALAGDRFGLSWVALRYFNAAGADPSLPCCEWHEPETHLIPNTLLVAKGYKDNLQLFGTDHPTPDGTAIRDYVHVSDLARAHVAALGLLNEGKGNLALNLGVGKGYSVREVIDAARQVTGLPISVIETKVREGDPPILVSDPTAASKLLDWTPKHTLIDDMVSGAWTWYNINGFRPPRAG